MNKLKNFYALVIIFSLILIFPGCGLSPENNDITIQIDENLLADAFGDHDGSVSAEELEKIEDFFFKNHDVWCIDGYPSDYWESNEIPVERIKECFGSMRPIGPYKSEAELRKKWEGINIRTPFLGVYVLRKTNGYVLYKMYRSPGPRISTAEWVEISIK